MKIPWKKVLTVAKDVIIAVLYHLPKRGKR